VRQQTTCKLTARRRHCQLVPRRLFDIFGRVLPALLVNGVTSEMKYSCLSLVCIVGVLLVTACSSGLNAPTGPGSPASTAVPTPLPEGSYKAEITPINPPKTLKAGQPATLSVKVKNIGNGPWPAQGLGPKYKVDLGNHWFDSKGTEVAGDDGRTALPHDIKPGEEAELILKVKPPKTPGQYVIVLDMVHEDITWFALRGSTPVKLNVAVE
jgi:hypothetical protein